MANTHSLDLEASSSQYASITDASQTGLDISTDFSIEFWINLESLTGNMAFVSKDGITSGNRSYSVYKDTNHRIIVEWYNSSGSRSAWSSTDPVFATANLGQWIHLAFTADISVPSVTAYMNGIALAGSMIATATTTINTNSVAFHIGSRPNLGGTDLYLDGKLDEVRIYSDIRTASEIKDNMFTDSPTGDNLQGYWKLNNDYTDASGNGNTLTASGSPTFTTDVPFPTYTTLNPVALGSTTLGSDANLQGYWSLDDVLTDGSGNGYTLTNNNSASFNTGKFNNGIDLEVSSSQSLTRATASNLAITGNRTFGAWIKPESFSAEMCIIGKSNTGTSILVRLTLPTSGKPYFQISNLTAGNLSAHSSVAITTGELYFLVGTYDGSNLNIYINGILVGQTAATGTSTDPGGQFGIGILGSSTSFPQRFDGVIDDPFVFNRALTDTEVFELYTGLNLASNIKSFIGIDRANIKSVSGVAIANIGSINGIE